MGNPIDCSTIDNIMVPAPGTPAVPIDANVAVKTTVNIAPILKGNQYT